MKLIHLTLAGALLMLLGAASGAARAQAAPQDNPLSRALEAAPSPESIPSDQLRNMTAAEFQKHIDEEGAQHFVKRFIRDMDPHSPEEPNYDIVLEHVAEGSNGWLHAAAQIAPYTDAVFSQGIRVAIADALVVNPVGVLKLVGTEEHFDEACGYPFVHQTDHYMLRHKREALAALDRVHQPALAEKKQNCRKQLMDVPTASAASASDVAPAGPLTRN